MTPLDWYPLAQRRDLVADPVRAALQSWEHAQVEVTEIDPGIADTAALVAASDVELGQCANCIVVSGRRAEVERVAAVLVLATTRADVNTTVRKALDVRKASFLPMDRAVQATGMEYGGITPIGLPLDWPLLVDAAVVQVRAVVIGSGLRRSKLRLPGELVASLPGAQVVPDLAR